MTVSWLPASNSYTAVELEDMGTSLEGSDEKHSIDKHHEFVSLSVKEVDTAAELASGEKDELDPEEALRVRLAFSLGMGSNSSLRTGKRSTSIYCR